MEKILVDGSNVLFWRGGEMQHDAPALVLRALMARRFAPVLYFDNSIHKYLGERALTSLTGIAEMIIAPCGTSADTLLLNACEAGRFQIVSCDRFQMWRHEYPAMRRDWRVSGRIAKGGRVSFSKTLRAAPL